MSLGERCYRLLLLLYPRAFRARYGPELVELFRERRARRLAEGRPAALSFWWWLLTDLVVTSWEERTRPAAATRGPHGGVEWMRDGIDDIRYAARRLRGSPGFTLAATLILTLGIGVGTAAFSVVNALLFQAPPFEAPERVVLLLQDSDDGVPNSTSYPAYEDIRRTADVFDEVAAHSTAAVFMEQEGALVPMLAEYATSSYLRVLGLTPSRGRWFDEVADDPTGQPTAVLTHRVWTDRLGSDPDVVGTTLRIGGSSVMVVGVGPEEFNGGYGPTAIDLWLSISAMAPTGGPARSLDRRQDHPFQVRARLADGVEIARAADAMDRLAADLAARFPAINRDRGITVLPLERSLTPQARAQVVPAAALSMGVVVIVFLVGTLNLANLLLVRTSARARELAVRLALGSSRGRLVRVVLSEAMLLAALGGGSGLLVAAGATGMMSGRVAAAGLPVALDLRWDMQVVLFAAALSLGAGLVFGLLPALRATCGPLRPGLGADASAVIGARRRLGLTGVLVAGQVAASLVLLAVAGVFLEGLVRAQSADPGFRLEGTGFVSLGTQPLGLDAGESADLHERLSERLGAVPGIELVAAAAVVPGRMFGTTTLLLGSGLGGPDTPTEVPWNYVEPGFFEVLGIPLLEGRAFRDGDGDGAPIAIVSRTMAVRFWGRVDVVGERYFAESAPEAAVRIVGVVGDVATRALGEDPRPSVYYPSDGALRQPTYVFASTGPPGVVLTSARTAIADVDPRILLLAVTPMREHLGATLDQQRVVGLAMAALGGLALVLALLGLYGMVSYAVSRRRAEIGVRIALGAGRQTVVGLFIRDVAIVVVAGGVIGIALSLPLASAVGRAFIGAPATPLAVLLPAVMLAATGLVATLVPALRAARTDPRLALRAD